uniref:LRRNT domain-containing protein n=1 Tax=Ciona intestinalis TaxID=7719 RepID=H2XMU3_CIOIN
CPSACECYGTTVNCTGRNLVSIPTNIPSNAVTLLLGHNKISSVSTTDLSDLDELRILDLSHNELTAIADHFLSRVPSLRYLTIKHSPLKKLPETFFSRTARIRRITLNENQLKSISPTLFLNCSALQKVDISGNKVTHFPPIALKTYQYLLNNTWLNVSSQTATRISVYEASSSIRALDFSHNKLATFPRDVLKLIIGLKTLNLSNNEIVITIQDLQTPLFNRNLRVLDLSNNRIAYVTPALFSSLRNLMRLHLHGNSLTIFSLHFVVYSPYLKELTLQNNEIANLANDSFTTLGNLRSLNLSRNRISHIDSGAFAGLLNLEILDLSDNRLTVFDGSILNSPQLNTLILSNNFLVRLSFNPNAASITNLDIRNNRIQNFPSFPNHHFQARLSGNHWQCTCSMLNSLSRIDVLDSCDGNNTCVYCDTPPEFQGQKISSIS